MFVISMNAQKRRLIPTVLCLALIAAMLIAALCYPAERTMVTSANAAAGHDDEACATFLTSLGYTAELPAVQVKEIRLPDEFDETLTAYNETQRQMGYDLSAYAGQRVKLRTYALAEHPDGHACEAHIYVYKGLIIGGDIAALDGTFTDPLCDISSLSCELRYQKDVFVLQRLDKLLADQTTLSRRDAAARIRGGRVTVNGTPVRDPSQKVDEASCEVTLDGQAVSYRKFLYIMMNKPAGILCVSRDPHAETVVDLLAETERCRQLFPAGRLDKDTTGMVLLTDDGDYAHRMLAPKKHVPKRYLVTLDGDVNEETCRRFAEGMTLANGEVCREASCEILPRRQALVTLHEGKYHQIKRMFAACGYHVEALHRLSMGGLELDPSLAAGDYKILSETEAMTVFL